MSKTKEEECLDACTEATKLDGEADDLPQGSPEKVCAMAWTSSCVLHLFTPCFTQVAKWRQAVEKYERAIALLVFVANQKLKSLESFKKT